MEIFKNTIMKYLLDDCLDRFGYKRGLRIFAISEKRLEDFYADSPYKKYKKLYAAMKKTLYPAAAYYLTLVTNCGIPRPDALSLAMMTGKKGEEKCFRHDGRFRKSPFFYTVLKKRLIKSTRAGTKSYFPKELFGTDLQKFDKKEIYLEHQKCAYFEESKRIDAPEICRLVCLTDMRVMADCHRNVQFEKSGAICEGDDYCDFRLMNRRVRRRHRKRQIKMSK